MPEKKLIEAIDNAFDPTAISAFLESLLDRGARIRDFQVVASSDLNDMLPASPFVRGETFEGFLTIYEGLDQQAQQRVREHYESRVEAVPAHVKTRFAKVFRK
jgi:hypothetical protein